MKFIELTILKNDIDTVLRFLGMKGAIQFPDSKVSGENPEIIKIKQNIEKVVDAAAFIGIKIKNNETEKDDSMYVFNENDEIHVNRICSFIENLKNRQTDTEKEKKHVSDTLYEIQTFSKLNIPFSELEQLSYLTLRIGHLDPKGQAEIIDKLGDRTVIIPLGSDNKILAVCSKKGRFAMDSQLKKSLFEPIKIPEDYKGIPSEIIKNLEEQLVRVDEEIENIKNEKETLFQNYAEDIKRLVSSWKTALLIEEIKARFIKTENLYNFSGWIPQENVQEITKDLMELTNGRVAIKSYSPQEIPSVAEGKEKVPIYLKHKTFIKGFEGVVFSYGAPLYGTIDPTPLVAFFFTILFGIMFGDVGQGFVLFLAGILIKKGPKQFSKFMNFSIPLISIGISSMFFGVVFGAVFANEWLLVEPTRAISGFITGNPVDRFIPILPMEETGGSLTKLLYFFGFTIAIGAILISIGLIINIINRCILKKYETAFFSKTGLAGLILFWYAIFIACLIMVGANVDLIFISGLLIPAFCIFFGPLLWRIITREKPVIEHGLMAFIMEGFVEVLETVSTYVSNTISFLRVGAFALSHSILSFIVFTFYGKLASAGIAGTLSAVFIMILGNAIIIVLEGMIVAIQVVRLQYYEFFNKFFVETGVEFSPFRFKTAK
jgi:V/A-type H+-transporting ATPase subunit I